MCAQRKDARVLQGPVTQHLNRGEEDAKIGRDIDHEALAQGHVNVITGACMAIGIKVSNFLPLPPWLTAHTFAA